jgi:hypothetical protein
LERRWGIVLGAERRLRFAEQALGSGVAEVVVCEQLGEHGPDLALAKAQVAQARDGDWPVRSQSKSADAFNRLTGAVSTALARRREEKKSCFFQSCGRSRTGFARIRD